MRQREDEARQKRADVFEAAIRRSGCDPTTLLIKLLRADEAAALLGKSEGAIRVMTHRKEIPVVRNGRTVRYRMLDLLVWVEEHTSPILS